ncbi:MAG: RIP metalloprotease RseP [Saprospiraceae bacterium]|nr:RIP metalloprotease RseP [Saprospiraceae bacterium]
MWITVAQFFLSLSILVILHEWGHFSAAKWFKTRVEKFYLFFNPGFTLFKFQKGETEYGIGWLPFGGYVKISGMIDESFDKDQMQGEPQPWEFRSKPAWQRLIIMVGGVTVNFILGILIFSMLFWVYGESYIPNDKLPHGIAVDSMAYEMGLRDGDQLLQVGELELVKFRGGLITKEIVINEAKSIKLNRDGQEMTIEVPESIRQSLTKYDNRNVRLVTPRFPYVVDGFSKESIGKQAGMQINDRIISLNGQATPFAHDFMKAFKEVDENITIGILRGADTLNFDLTLGEDKLVGITAFPAAHFIDLAKEKYSFGASIPAGWNKSWTFLTDQVKAFGQMFSGKIKAKDSLGSFITIGKMFGTTWDWERFWSMTAMLSILLGFINLLPIPALDGGYVMFLLFESITGIKVPDRVMEIANLIGFALLIILMIYALGLDISRLF